MGTSNLDKVTQDAVAKAIAAAGIAPRPQPQQARPQPAPVAPAPQPVQSGGTFEEFFRRQAIEALQRAQQSPEIWGAGAAEELANLPYEEQYARWKTFTPEQQDLYANALTQRAMMLRAAGGN